MDKNLRAFLAVARGGSITAAAQTVNLAQSSVTKRIAALEAELETPLFFRERHGMLLTEAGGMLLARAERIEREYSNGLEEIAAISSAGLSRLRVGAGPVFHLNWVAELFTELLERFPDLTLDLNTEYSEDMGKSLTSGALDVYLGILSDDETDSSIFSKHITEVEQGIVLRDDDPISNAAATNPADLVDYRWVTFTTDRVTEELMERYAAPKGAKKFLIGIRTSSLATGVQLVKTGRFAMSAPLQLAQAVEKEGLVIRPVLQRMPRRSAGLHVRKSSMGHGAIKTVISYFDRIQAQMSVRHTQASVGESSNGPMCKEPKEGES